MTKKLEVTIKRSGKLTVTEINALTSKTLQEASDLITTWNKTFQETAKYRKDLKALKTKHGILAAERAILFASSKHKKVSITVTSSSYEQGKKDLDASYAKNRIHFYKGGSEFESVKNKLIIAQIDNVNMVQFAKTLIASLVK
jgi:hypothetical protein